MERKVKAPNAVPFGSVLDLERSETLEVEDTADSVQHAWVVVVNIVPETRIVVLIPLVVAVPVIVVVAVPLGAELRVQLSALCGVQLSAASCPVGVEICTLVVPVVAIPIPSSRLTHCFSAILVVAFYGFSLVLRIVTTTMVVVCHRSWCREAKQRNKRYQFRVS